MTSLRLNSIRLATAVLVLLIAYVMVSIGSPANTPASEADAEERLPSMIELPAVTYDEPIQDWTVIRVDPIGGASGSPDTQRVRSFQAALEIAAAQQTPKPTRIILAAGTYESLGLIRNIRRSASSPIAISGTLDAAGIRKTLIDGQADGNSDAGSTCIRLSNVSYVVLENIHCQHAFPHGVNIDDGADYSTPSHHIIIRNWRISRVGLFRQTTQGTNSDCLKLSGVNDFHVLESEFDNCVWGEFIDMVGSHRGVIADNYFHDKPGNGIQTKGGSSDILITRNEIARVGGRFVQLGGDTGTPYYRPIDAPYPASRIRVIANLLKDVGIGTGADQTGSVAFSLNGCRDCLIAHNSVLNIHAGGGAVYIDTEEADLSGNSNVVLANNIYVLSDVISPSQAYEETAYRVSRRGRSDAGRVYFRNEIHYGKHLTDFERMVLPAGLHKAQFRGVRVTAPRLGAEGTPLPGSPVLNAGAPEYNNLVPGDYTGQQYEEIPSIGAYSSPAMQLPEEDLIR